MPKTYTINEKQFTIAPVTPKRLAAYCGILGITDASQFKAEGFISDLGVASFNVSISTDKCNSLLAACLAGDTSTIDAGDVPVEIIDGISNDFFSQRFVNLPKQTPAV